MECLICELCMLCPRFAALHGVWTLLGGNLVAVKQINPDLTVISVPQIRAKVGPRPGKSLMHKFIHCFCAAVLASIHFASFGLLTSYWFHQLVGSSNDIHGRHGGVGVPKVLPAACRQQKRRFG